MPGAPHVEDVLTRDRHRHACLGGGQHHVRVAKGPWRNLDRKNLVLQVAVAELEPLAPGPHHPGHCHGDGVPPAAAQHQHLRAAPRPPNQRGCSPVLAVPTPKATVCSVATNPQLPSRRHDPPEVAAHRHNLRETPAEILRRDAPGHVRPLTRHAILVFAIPSIVSVIPHQHCSNAVERRRVPQPGRHHDDILETTHSLDPVPVFAVGNPVLTRLPLAARIDPAVPKQANRLVTRTRHHNIRSATRLDKPVLGGIHIRVVAGPQLAKVIAAPGPDNASFRQSAKVARSFRQSAKVARATITSASPGCAAEAAPRSPSPSAACVAQSCTSRSTGTRAPPASARTRCPRPACEYRRPPRPRFRPAAAVSRLGTDAPNLAESAFRQTPAGRRAPSALRRMTAESEGHVRPGSQMLPKTRRGCLFTQPARAAPHLGLGLNVAVLVCGL